MKKVKFINNMSRTFNKIGFKIAKHSPEILVTAGIIGTVASTVMACKATTKASKILENAKKDIDTIHECTSDESLSDKYTQEDSKKDLTIVYAQTGIKLVKLYAPSVILGMLSVSCIATSHKILNKRNAALSAAYTAVDRGFKEYRKRVEDKYGKDAERELRYNIKAREIEETVTDEKGKEKTVKNTVETVDSALDCSPYAKFFDESSPYWEKNAEYNLMFLRAQQNYANDLLKAKGRLFLNEVYEMLGIEPTKAGQVVGWVYDAENPVGDNYVDFGIYDTSKTATRRFVNGTERVILLDFNVDGNIWENM